MVECTALSGYPLCGCAWPGQQCGGDKRQQTVADRPRRQGVSRQRKGDRAEGTSATLKQDIDDFVSVASAAVAGAKYEDETCVSEPGTSFSDDDGLGIPLWLLRTAPMEAREGAWMEHCQETGIDNPQPLSAPAREIKSDENPNLASTPSRPDLYVEHKRQKASERIAKMKVRQERRALAATGVTTAMPLEGKAALASIRAAQPRRRKHG